MHLLNIRNSKSDVMEVRHGHMELDTSAGGPAVGVS